MAGIMTQEEWSRQANQTLRGQIQFAAAAVDGCEDLVTAIENALEGPKPQAVNRVPEFTGGNSPLPPTPLSEYVTRLLDSLNGLRNRLERLNQAIG